MSTDTFTLVGRGGVGVDVVLTVTDCVPPSSPPSLPPPVLAAGGGVVETEFGDVVCVEILKSEWPSIYT